MEAKDPLLGKPAETAECIGTRMKVAIYVLIFGCAFQVSGIAEPQYIYNFIKTHHAFNSSNVKTVDNNSKHCDDNSSSSSDDVIQELTSEWTWYVQLAEAGVALPVLILAGPVADKIGRKPLLLWNVTIGFVSLVLRTIIVYRNMNLYYYVGACGFLGLSGSFYVFHLANLAILADTTSKGNERSFTLAIYDTMLGIGTVTSQVGTGYLIQLVGFVYPYLISSGLVLGLLLLISVTLSESWEGNNDNSKLNIRYISNQMCSLWTNKSNVNGNLKSFVRYFVIYLFYYVPLTGVYTLKTIYILGAPFCWTSEHIGWYGAATDFVMYLAGTFLLKFTHTFCVCLKDEVVAIIGILSAMSFCILYGLSTDNIMVYIATAVGILRMLPLPLLKAFLSRLVPKNKHGVLFSNIYLLEVASKLGGSTLFNNIYDHTLSIYNGLVFFVMAGISLPAFLLMIFVSCTNKQTMYTDLEEDDPVIQNVERVDTNDVHV